MSREWVYMARCVVCNFVLTINQTKQQERKEKVVHFICSDVENTKKWIVMLCLRQYNEHPKVMFPVDYAN